MSKRTTKKELPVQTSKSETLSSKLNGRSPDTATAQLAVAGMGMNAVATVKFSRYLGEVDLTECLNAIVGSFTLRLPALPWLRDEFGWTRERGWSA